MIEFQIADETGGDWVLTPEQQEKYGTRIEIDRALQAIPESGGVITVGSLNDGDTAEQFYRLLAARSTLEEYGVWWWKGKPWVSGRMMNSAQMAAHLVAGRGEQPGIVTKGKHSGDWWNQASVFAPGWAAYVGRVVTRKPWLRSSVLDDSVDVFPLIEAGKTREAPRTRTVFGSTAEAVRVCMRPFERHKFRDSRGKSAVLAGVLIACAREHLGGKVPAIAINGYAEGTESTAGSGKSLIAESLLELSLRDAMTVTPKNETAQAQTPGTAWNEALINLYARKENGQEPSVVLFEEIGGAKIDIKGMHQAITSGVIDTHVPKGHSGMILTRETPWMLFTGNGLQWVADMDRRRVQVDLLAQPGGWADGWLAPEIARASRREIEDAAAYLLRSGGDVPESLRGMCWTEALTRVWRAVGAACKAMQWDAPSNDREVDETHLIAAEVVRRAVARADRVSVKVPAMELYAIGEPVLRTALNRRARISTTEFGKLMGRAAEDSSTGVQKTADRKGAFYVFSPRGANAV